MKTGTSFGNTLALWACPELDPNVIWVKFEGALLPPSCLSRFRVEPGVRKDWPIGDHYSLINRTDVELRSVVTMLRWPPAFVASWYHYFRHNGKPPNRSATEDEICRVAQQRGFLHRMGVRIAGIENSDVKAFTEDDIVVESCRRLNLFAFVGLTDFYDASICLFHAMHGGKLHPSELINVRKGKRWKSKKAVQYADCGTGVESTLNDRVFQCGVQIFKQRMKKYPDCWQYVEAVARPLLLA